MVVMNTKNMSHFQWPLRCGQVTYGQFYVGVSMWAVLHGHFYVANLFINETEGS